MIKEELLKYSIFQKLLELKLLLKGQIRKTQIAKYFYDKNALKSFGRYLDQKDFIYEKEVKLIKHLVKEEDSVFDIGANRGEFTYYFSKALNETGRIFAFEPGKRAYSILSKLKSKYNLSNVTLNRIALSDSEGIMELVVPYHNRQASIKSFEAIKGKIEKIQTSTIDAFTNSNGIKKLNIIKCDTEGSELLVFKGGVNTLKVFTPTIIVEIAEIHTRRFGYAGEEVKVFLEDLGYKTFYYDFVTDKLANVESIQLKNEGHVWSRVTEDLSNNNYIFIHETKIHIFKSLIN